MNTLDEYVKCKIWSYLKDYIMKDIKTILQPLKNLNDIYYSDGHENNYNIYLDHIHFYKNNILIHYTK